MVPLVSDFSAFHERPFYPNESNIYQKLTRQKTKCGTLHQHCKTQFFHKWCYPLNEFPKSFCMESFTTQHAFLCMCYGCSRTMPKVYRITGETISGIPITDLSIDISCFSNIFLPQKYQRFYFGNYLMDTLQYIPGRQLFTE